jgi:predicted transcriptional regulator
MGQGEVINAMKDDEWVTAVEVSERIKLRAQSVARNLWRLYQWDDVERRIVETSKRGRTYEYRKKGE